MKNNPKQEELKIMDDGTGGQKTPIPSLSELSGEKNGSKRSLFPTSGRVHENYAPLASFSSRAIASIIDNFLLAVLGGILTGSSTFLLALPFIALSLQSIATLALNSIIFAFVGGIFYGAFSVIPVLPAALVLTIQCKYRFLVGAYVLSHICTDHTNINALSGFGFQCAAIALTFFYAVGPVLLAPLYHALMESSKNAATIGKGVVGISVRDSEGNRITFARALLRQLLATCSCLLYGIGFISALPPFRLTLHDALAKTRVMSDIAVVRRGRETENPSSNELVIPYHAFPVMERWLRQRFGWLTNKTKTKMSGKKMAVFATAPIVVYGGIHIVPAIVTGAFKLFNIPIGRGAAIPSGVTDANVQVVFCFFLIVILLAAYVYEMYSRHPNRLAINKEGLRFLSGRKNSPKLWKLMPWNEINQIRLEQPSKRTSLLDNVLAIYRSGSEPLLIKLGSIESVDDKEKILHAIETWAPSVDRDAEVIQALQPPADYSYTEMWLQALTAPPKRERLQPLVEDALLKDGAYRIISPLGAGGQGFAYTAFDTVSGETVVLKEFILPVFVDIAVRKNSLEKFEAEGKILKHLQHDKIVKLVDFFVEDHRAYLVLEHIDGENLNEIVKKQGKMSEEQVRSLAQQMCEILGYLHNLAPPVVHRDFTPDNLILRKDGTLKLIDFNVAHQTESTTTGSVVGKHAYLPPEQFRGQVSPSSDIYSFGATLYFLLVGHDPEAISMSHPQKENSAVSAALDQLVAKATALTAAARYQSIDELHKDLSSSTSI